MRTLTVLLLAALLPWQAGPPQDRGRTAPQAPHVELLAGLTVDDLATSLADPKANPEVRRIAFLSLAAFSRARARAVLAARDTTRTVPTIAESMHLGRVGPTPHPGGLQPVDPGADALLVATQRDSHGVLWGLLRSGVLGCEYDYWLVRHDGKRWVKPLFIGFPAEEDDWLRLYAGSELLSRDTDRDGLTDYEEERLGTDPRKADTDGDGIPDGRDANPLAGAQPTTDEEKALAAAFEGRFRFTAEGARICTVEMTAGMRPVELRGRSWFVVHLGQGEPPLRRLWGTGVAAIRFLAPGGPSGDTGPPLRAGFLSSGATEAAIVVDTQETTMSATSCLVRVRKFGADWLPVSCELVSIA